MQVIVQRQLIIQLDPLWNPQNHSCQVICRRVLVLRQVQRYVTWVFRTKYSDPQSLKSRIHESYTVWLELPVKLFIWKPLDCSLQLGEHISRVVGGLVIGLELVNFDDVGNLVEFYVFTDLVFSKMIEHGFEVVFVDVNPILHVWLFLTRQIRLNNKSIKHNSSFWRQKQRIYRNCLVSFSQLFHVIRCHIVQKLCYFRAPNRDNSSIFQLREPADFNRGVET